MSSFEFDATKPRPVCLFPPQPVHTLNFYPCDKKICHNYANGSTEALPQNILVGPQLSRVDLCMGYNMLVVIGYFKPAGLHRLLHIPMHQMIDRSFDISLFLGKEISNITEQLYEATDFDRMNCIIQLYLLKKVKALKPLLPVDIVLAGMLHNNTPVSVDELGHHACVSNWQLERQFKERIGMSPKVYLRLARFS